MKTRSIALALLAAAVLMVSPAHALVALPDAGVNYGTMTVENPAPLAQAGMKDVKRGDSVTVEMTEEGQLRFTNQRTRESIIFPSQ